MLFIVQKPTERDGKLAQLVIVGAGSTKVAGFLHAWNTVSWALSKKEKKKKKNKTKIPTEVLRIYNSVKNM